MRDNGAGFGISAEFGAELSAKLGDLGGAVGTLNAALRAQEEYRMRCRGAMQQVPIVSPQVSGSGTIDVADALGAKTGYYWGIRRLVAVGFSAGSVTIYKNASGGEIIAAFATAGIPQTYGRAEMLLNPGDRLVIVGTGITGTVQVTGVADCFETWYLPVYIG